MALITWKFVDQPIASPSVLFDMNNGTTTRVLDPGPQMPAPPLKRSIAQNAMSDGGLVTSAAYDLRELTFTVFLNDTSSLSNRIALLDALKAQLAKPNNLLMFTPPGGSNPVFFQTLRSDEYVPDYQGAARMEWKIQCTVLAQPFAIGVRRDIAQVTVVNDPANSSTALNSNTSFETNTTGWTGVGGTLVRDTTQFHSGVASGKITPDGVTATVLITSANVSVTGGATYRAQAWLRCAVGRTIALNINWYDAAAAYISTGSGSVTVSPTTWTFISTDMVAPSNAAGANIIPTMTGTPPATNVLNVDEVELRAVPSGNAAVLDITGIVGDSPTPAFARVALSSGTAPTIFWAQRTANNPTAVTVVAQAEAGTLGTDTTVQAPDTAMSGNNFVRTTFATASLTTRLTVTVPTASSPEALRGRYRVLVKVRMSATGSNFTMRYVQNPTGANSVSGQQISFDSAATITTIDLGVIDFPGPGPTPVTIGYSGLAAGYATQTLAIQIARNSGTATFDMDYVYLLPADERCAQFRRVNWAASSYTIIDGPQELAYGMASGTSPFGATRTVDNAGGLASYFGGFPMLVPSATNRWHVLIASQGALTSSTWDVSYWPRWREVATS